jgi:hypothetical protein
MASSPKIDILRLDRPNDEALSNTHYLAEYDAIIVKPEWQRLVVTGPSTAEVMRSEQTLGRKSTELGDFLSAGGLLVVLVVPLEQRLLHGPVQHEEDNHHWWARQLEPMFSAPQVVTPGSGTSVVPTGCGSEFDGYLDAIQSYQTRLSAWFDDNDNVQILAHNRAGGAIAAEIAVGSGMIVCVPPPLESHAEELMLKAINSYLGHRFGPGLKWPQREEEELRKDREKLLADFHTGMSEITAKQEVVQERKRAVFSISQVNRGVRYFERAARPGSTPQQTLEALYTLIEMLKDYYGPIDWNGLGDALGVSHKSIERIKVLANKKELHLRHTTAADPEGIDQADIDRVIADGRAILGAFIAREYAEGAAKTPTPNDLGSH